jgi:hypothetical protein
MGARSTAAFRKLKTCPPAETLLIFRDAGAGRDSARRQQVAAHLSCCEFCGAELQLLSRFAPSGPPQIRPAKMPWALYRLAKDLLALPARAVEVACERDRLTLTDA